MWRISRITRSRKARLLGLIVLLVVIFVSSVSNGFRRRRPRNAAAREIRGPHHPWMTAAESSHPRGPSSNRDDDDDRLPEKSLTARKQDTDSGGFVHNPTSVCRDAQGDDAQVFILFLVMSEPRNLEKRNIIRATYGNRTVWPNWKRGEIRAVFLMSRTDDDGVQQHIDVEARRHADIIQSGDFVDGATTTTSKILTGFRWVASECRHALLVMKMEDDCMMNQGKLLRRLVNQPRVNFTMGEVMTRMPVSRVHNDTFYVSKKQYPYSFFPPYLHGAAYILSTDLVLAVLDVAKTRAVFDHADAFVGLCLQKSGVHLYQLPNYLLTVGLSVEGPKVVVRLKRAVVVPYLSPNQMRVMWISTHEHA